MRVLEPSQTYTHTNTQPTFCLQVFSTSLTSCCPSLELQQRYQPCPPLSAPLCLASVSVAAFQRREKLAPGCHAIPPPPTAPEDGARTTFQQSSHFASDHQRNKKATHKGKTGLSSNKRDGRRNPDTEQRQGDNTSLPYYTKVRDASGVGGDPWMEQLPFPPYSARQTPGFECCVVGLCLRYTCVCGQSRG